MFSLKLSVTRLKKREYNMYACICNGNFMRGLSPGSRYLIITGYMCHEVIAPASNTKPSTHTLTHHTL